MTEILASNSEEQNQESQESVDVEKYIQPVEKLKDQESESQETGEQENDNNKIEVHREESDFNSEEDQFIMLR